MELLHSDAEAYFKERKMLKEKVSSIFPPRLTDLRLSLTSDDGAREYTAIINRKSIRSDKITYSALIYKGIALRRLDWSGPGHQNPTFGGNTIPEWLKVFSGEVVECPHMHVYIYGYNTRLAAPIASVPGFELSSDDNIDIMKSFFDYCSMEMPEIAHGLF